MYFSRRKGIIIVSGSGDKTLLCWDAKTGRKIGVAICGHAGGVLCAAISPCGKMIVSGSQTAHCGCGTPSIGT